MTKWIDNNHIDGEMSDAEFLVQVTTIMTKRIEKENAEGKPGNYGNDGLVEVYAESYPLYRIKVMHYFCVTRTSAGIVLRDATGNWNKINKHVAVEGIRPPASILSLLNIPDCLWHDTFHHGQENWSLMRQWQYAMALAERDITEIDALKQQWLDKLVALELEGENWLKQLTL